MPVCPMTGLQALCSQEGCAWWMEDECAIPALARASWDLTTPLRGLHNEARIKRRWPERACPGCQARIPAGQDNCLVCGRMP